MTDREKAIVMAHTGICMLAEDKFQIFHKYVEDIMDRPIWTHEIGWLADAIKENSKADFMALCADEGDSEELKIGHCKDCRWWKDSDGVFRRGIGAESKCPMNTKEIYEGDAFCYRFEPQENKDKE